MQEIITVTSPIENPIFGTNNTKNYFINSVNLVQPIYSIDTPLPQTTLRPVLCLRIYFRQWFYLAAKRCFDVLFSLLVVLFLLSWLLPLLALLIKYGSRGPVFFVQKRVGFLGRSFFCIKLRTMHLNREAHALPAGAYDSRITTIGRFLRRTGLDELPQFFNVLCGHMSIIGPRPHMHADCIAFGKLLPGYRLRTIARPGITGLAQCQGFRGPFNNEWHIQRRFQLDVWYIRNRCFALDLKIMKATVLVMVNDLLTQLKHKKEKRQTPHKNLSSPSYAAPLSA